MAAIHFSRRCGTLLLSAAIAASLTSAVIVPAEAQGLGVKSRKAAEHRAANGGYQHRAKSSWRRHRDRNAGDYVGNLSAERDPGNGTYFYLDRDDYGVAAFGQTGPKVLRPGRHDACETESGVCVIRPGQ